MSITNFFANFSRYNQKYIGERCPGWLDGTCCQSSDFLEQTAACGAIYGLVRALFDSSSYNFSTVSSEKGPIQSVGGRVSVTAAPVNSLPSVSNGGISVRVPNSQLRNN